MTWDDLNMSQRSEVIAMHLQAGVSDLGEIRESYNSFEDGGPTESSKSGIVDRLVGALKKTTPYISPASFVTVQAARAGKRAVNQELEHAKREAYMSIRPGAYPMEQIQSGELFSDQYRMENPDEIKQLWDSAMTLNREGKAKGEAYRNVAGRIRDISTGSSDLAVHRTPMDEDAWRLYLGMQQIGDSFIESEYKPTISSDPDARYYNLGNRHDREFMRRSSVDLFNQPDREGHSAFGDIGPTALANGRVVLSPDSTYLGIIDKNDYVPDKVSQKVSSATKGIIDPSKAESRFFNTFEVYDRVYIDKDHLRRTGKAKPAKTHNGYIVDPNRDYKAELAEYSERAKDNFYLRDIMLPE